MSEREKRVTEINKGAKIALAAAVAKAQFAPKTNS